VLTIVISRLQRDRRLTAKVINEGDEKSADALRKIGGMTLAP